MTKEKAKIIIGNIPIPIEDCYTITEYQEAKAEAINALEQDNEEIFKQFKKKVFLESEDVLGNEMVDSYMITDYLAELMGVEND